MYRCLTFGSDLRRGKLVSGRDRSDLSGRNSRSCRNRQLLFLLIQMGTNTSLLLNSHSHKLSSYKPGMPPCTRFRPTPRIGKAGLETDQDIPVLRPICHRSSRVSCGAGRAGTVTCFNVRCLAHTSRHVDHINSTKAALCVPNTGLARSSRAVVNHSAP
jgi:hypothetical protein